MRKKFLVIWIIVSEIIYSGVLTLAMKNSRENTDSQQESIIQGFIHKENIDIPSEIDFKNIGYGRTGKVSILLIAQSDSCKIHEILTECSCTTFSIKEPQMPTQKGDTITINIEMKGVERGLQMRRIHIFQSTERDAEPKSLTLIANVK